jgi:hypothetical protein
MGWLYDYTHRYAAGLLAIGACLGVGAAVTAMCLPRPA